MNGMILRFCFGRVRGCRRACLSIVDAFCIDFMINCFG